jgi:hypothetical protein
MGGVRKVLKGHHSSEGSTKWNRKGNNYLLVWPFKISAFIINSDLGITIYNLD